MYCCSETQTELYTRCKIELNALGWFTDSSAAQSHLNDMHWRDMQVIWCTYISLQREPQCMHSTFVISHRPCNHRLVWRSTYWQPAKDLRNHWMLDKLNTATWRILEGTFQAPWLQQWTPTMVVTLWPNRLMYLQHLFLPSKIQRLLERLEFQVSTIDPGNYIMPWNDAKWMQGIL